MKKTLLFVLLTGSQLALSAALTLPTAAPVRPGGIVISGQAEVMPHSGSSAIDATEAGGYKPLVLSFSGLVKSASGEVNIEYYPCFSTPESKTLFQSGSVTLTVTEQEIALSVAEKKHTAPCLFQPRVWYEIALRWEAGTVSVIVDDRQMISLKLPELPVDKTFTLGIADGLLRNVSFDRLPRTSPVEQLGGSPVKIFVRSNNDRFFTMDYFAHGQALKVRLRPNLKIAAGDRFAVIQSAGEPQYLTAQKDGELELEFGSSYSNRVEVRRDPGNLLASPDVKWTGIPEPGYTSCLSGIQAALPEKPVEPAAAADTVTWDDKNSTWIIDRKRDVGTVMLKSSEFPVKPDTAYLLGVYHKVLADTVPGGSFILRVKINAGGKLKKSFHTSHAATPLRHTGKNVFAPLWLKTPKSTEPLTAVVEFISDAAPCKIALSSPSLREYPSMVFQPMPRDNNREKLLTGKALLDYLAKRPAATAPRTDQPLSGVCGYDGDVYKMMGRCGADIQFIKAEVDHRERIPGWKSDGSYDFSRIDAKILNVLSYAPDALVGITVGLDPALDFGIVYPDAAWKDVNGKVLYMPTPDVRYYPERKGKKYPYVSYTAPDFRRESGKFLYALGAHLKAQPWGKAVAAIHLFGGGDGQFFYRPVKNDFSELMDRSAGNLAAMREAIRVYYRNDVSALRKAWGEPSVTFETIEFPSPESYRKHAYLRDPAVPQMRKVIDFARLYPQVITETLGFATREFERGIGRKILKSRYYFGTSYGHLLADPSFDILVSVPPYGVSRLHGAAGRVHQAPDSATLHKKAFLDELDLRTSYSPVAVYGPGNYALDGVGVEPGPEGFANVMRKMAAPALTAGQGYWYLMIGGNASLQDEFEPYVKESFDALKNGAGRTVTLPDQAALFWDEEARTLMGDRFGWAMDQHSTHRAQEMLYRSGISARMYLLRDLTHPARQPAKINIFALGSSMTQEQISFIEKNLQKDGNILVFVFDAGRTAPGGFEANIRRLTGMTVKAAPQGVRVLSAFGPQRFSDPLSKHILNAPPLTQGPFSMPLCYVDDPDAKPLALFNGSQVVGAAVKRHKNWTAVYLGIPIGLAVTPDFFRALALEAGLTPFAPSGDVSYMGNGCVVIHATSAGNKMLTWGIPADVLDLSSGKIIKRNCVQMDVPMLYGETRWFRLLTPNK